MAERAERKKWGWPTRTLFVLLALVLYAFSTGPMTWLVVTLNGGSNRVEWPLRLLVVPYTPFYRALNYAPRPIFHFWKTYDGFFFHLAGKP
jgi:hypothetical protein